MLISFLCFPIFCFITIIFGYEWTVFLVMECVLGALGGVCFVFRTRFLVHYPAYIKKKRFYFETIATIACYAFAVGTGFAVHYDGRAFCYYPLNIYIQPLYLVFVPVLMGYLVGTAKRVAKASLAEDKRRRGEIHTDRKEP